MTYENLFKPGKIGKMEVKNRLVMPGMGIEMAGENGEVTDEIVNYYGRRARGGTGLITVEVGSTSTRIDPFRLFQHVMRFDDPKYIPGMKRLATAIKDGGARAGVQLTCGGGASDYGGPWDPKAKAEDLQYISPSGIPPVGSTRKPRILTTEEVEKLVELAGMVAGYTKEAGFEFIEIHSHYGYLIAEFLSAHYNKRTDKYGGPLENRMRLLLEIFAAMRKTVGPDFPLAVKYSIDEYIEGGRGIQESQIIAKKLEEAGADALTVSAGVAGSKMPANPPYFFPKGCWVHLAQALKDVVKIPVIVPARLHDPALAEQVLRDGKADFIAIGRGVIADPDWPIKVQKGQVDDVRWCIDCNECRQNVIVRRKPLRCAVNPVAGREGQYDVIKPAETKRKVVVVGGGPSGMEAARVAALRGHDVTLFEKSKNLGGLMALASVHNEEISYFTKYMVGQMKKLPIKVRLQTEATPALIDELKPDAVILGIGGAFQEYKIPGIDRNNVFSSKNLLDLVNGIPLKKGALLTFLTTVGMPFINTSMIRKRLGSNFPIKKNVAVIGGQFAGCSLGLALGKAGKKVTIFEESDKYGNDVEAHTMIAFNTQVEKGNVKVLTSTKVKEITGKGVVAIGKDKKEELYPAETIIVAFDLLPTASKLEKELKGKVKQVYTVGDAKSFRRLMSATSEGFDAAYNL